MKVEFHQGVPAGCTEWLTKHVGKGNITSFVDDADCAWFYAREVTYTLDAQLRYVPTITVKDPKLAAFFILRWG